MWAEDCCEHWTLRWPVTSLKGSKWRCVPFKRIYALIFAFLWSSCLVRVSLKCLEAHNNIIVEQYRNVFAILLRRRHPAVGENITYLGELSAVRWHCHLDTLGDAQDVYEMDIYEGACWWYNVYDEYVYKYTNMHKMNTWMKTRGDCWYNAQNVNKCEFMKWTRCILLSIQGAHVDAFYASILEMYSSTYSRERANFYI